MWLVVINHDGLSTSDREQLAPHRRRAHQEGSCGISVAWFSVKNRKDIRELMNETIGVSSQALLPIGPVATISPHLRILMRPCQLTRFSHRARGER